MVDIRSMVSRYGILSTMRMGPRYLSRSLTSLRIVISGTCNLNCIHCYVHNYDAPAKMSPSLFQKIEGELDDVFDVRLCPSTEALTHPEFISVIKKIKEHDCLLNFHTNGMLLSEDVSRKLVEYDVDWVGVSIDGAKPKTHNSIRKGSDLEEIIDNVETLQKLKKEKKSKFPFLKLTFVSMKRNYEELPAVIKLASKLGIDEMEVNGIEPYSKKMAKEALYLPENREDAREVFRVAENKARELDLPLWLPSLSPEKPSCKILEGIIRPDGEVCPCPSLEYERPVHLSIEDGELQEKKTVHKKVVFGNVNKDSIKNICNKPEFREFRKRVNSGDFPPACESCLVKHGIIC